MDFLKFKVQFDDSKTPGPRFVLGDLVSSWYLYIVVLLFARGGLNPSPIFTTHTRAEARTYGSMNWFRLWLIAWKAPSHYLKQCWITCSIPLSTNGTLVNFDTECYTILSVLRWFVRKLVKSFCISLHNFIIIDNGIDGEYKEYHLHMHATY